MDRRERKVWSEGTGIREAETERLRTNSYESTEEEGEKGERLDKMRTEQSTDIQREHSLGWGREKNLERKEKQ